MRVAGTANGAPALQEVVSMRRLQIALQHNLLMHTLVPSSSFCKPGRALRAVAHAGLQRVLAAIDQIAMPAFFSPACNKTTALNDAGRLIYPRRMIPKETRRMKVLLNAVLLGAVLANVASPALAEAPKKPTKKAVVRQEAAEKDDDLDVAQSKVVEMDCALGDKVTLYQNEDPKHIGMRWKKRLVRLEQVQTSTGAQRYESTKHHLVWIGIPAKGMLLDSKRGQQLANDCRSQEQVMAAQSQPPPSPQIFMDAKK
jgi:hypothetical protein